MLNIAVIGCGRIGQMHARNIARHPRARLASVFDVDAAAAQRVAGALNVPVAKSVDAILASDSVDAILIASSTSTHADLLERAVAAGKPVLCEKPIDLSLARVNQCAAVIRGTKVPIMLGFVRRFDPGHRATRNAVRDGTIGELHQVVITSRDPGMPPVAYTEVSGGIFRDMTIHDFDMARFVLGEEPVEVSAQGSRLVDPKLMDRLGDYDTVTVVLRTASGKQCVINNSRQALYGYDQRVEALGTLGLALSENRRPHEAQIHKREFTGQSAPYLNFFIERYAEAFDAEIDAFVSAVENQVAPEVGFEDGRIALMLAEAAIKSAAEGRVVRVSELG
ncbi:MAG: inositol 2-dehydrogenase [Burkholderiales bacterium]|nr:inositol 2-dehydrogenase [Burkholderiales bacterium]MDE2456464.1 inositol 2-dehydrogenase [Burkholderiales bacterium]